MTSKERAQLRAQANTVETTLMVGKGGISQQLIAEADKLLTAKELVKGRVLESAMMTTREVCDALCEATGCEGIQVVGSKFVIYRFSPKLEQERQEKAKAAKTAKKVNPVRVGQQKRKQAKKEEKERRREFFHDLAVKEAIERRKNQNGQ